MKNIVIAGNITKDAVLRRTQSGEPVLGFSVAVNDARSKSTVYFDCSLWGKRGDTLSAYLKKGTKVSASGDLGTREHDGKTYLTVNVGEVTLMGGGEPRQATAAQREPEPDMYGNDPSDLDDSIPF